MSQPTTHLKNLLSSLLRQGDKYTPVADKLLTDSDVLK